MGAASISRLTIGTYLKLYFKIRQKKRTRATKGRVRYIEDVVHHLGILNLVFMNVYTI